MKEVMKEVMKDWWIFRGTRTPHDLIEKKLPDPPPWRRYHNNGLDPSQLPSDLFIECKPGNEERGATYLSSETERDLVNAALYLRRPLLVTGGPGTGKTSLAYAVAYELKLGPVLVWPITTRSTLQQDGLCRYDALARLQATALEKDALAHLQATAIGKERQSTDSSMPTPHERQATTYEKEHKGTSKEQQNTPTGVRNEAMEIGRYLRLGPLGTALRTSRPKRPRVLLIDEIDKSDIDLPNDLLHILEEGQFEISELARLPPGEEYRKAKVRPSDDGPDVEIERGCVPCYEFPFIVMTSNGERDFPPPFLRRCLRLHIEPPSPEKLAQIIQLQLGIEPASQPEDLVKEFLDRKNDLATDQLLNAIFLTMHEVDLPKGEKLRQILLKSLSSS